MIEIPNDPISKLQSQPLEDRIEVDVQGEDFSIVDVVADLPANASIGRKESRQLVNNGFLSLQIMPKLYFLFVRLADIVRWRRDNQSEGSRGKLAGSVRYIALKKYKAAVG